MNPEEPRVRVVRELWTYAKPHKRLLALVVALSFVYTATDLLYPLVYRDVVNDIAGLFVKQAYDEALEDNSVLNDVIDELLGRQEDDSLRVSEAENDEQDEERLSADSTVKTSGAELDSISGPHRHPDSAARHERIVAKRNRLKQLAAKTHPHLAKHLAQSSGARDTVARSVPKHEADSTMHTRSDGLRGSGAEQHSPHGQNHVARRTPDQVLHTMIWAVVVLFILGMVGYALWLVAENISERIATDVEQSFLLDTFQHVLRLPFGFFRTRSSGVLTKQIDEADHISPIITNLSKHVLPNVVKMLGTLLVMFALNTELTLIALITIPPYIWLVRYSARRLEDGLSTYYELWERMSARLQNAMQSIKTVKLAGAESREIQALKELSTTAYTEYVHRTRVANRFVFWDAFISHLGSAIVLIVGGTLALKRQLTPGDVVMFVAYVEELYSPIDELSGVWIELQQSIASFTRTFKLLKSGEEEKPGLPLRVDKGLVEFENVHFAYSKRKILKGLSLRAEPGHITALVGASGTGKTTSMDLVLKLYDLKEGEIRIDGQRVQGLDPSSIRSHIGLVAADGTVFKATLRDNIRYAVAEASDEQVLSAIAAAGLSTLMERLSEGLDTEIGEGGIGLSVGERQRVQLARILVARPPILVLDEATANLDFATEREIRATIQEFRSAHTVIIIAHRYSMVKDADMVYVLEDGRVSEEGTPAELLKANGWFARFASSAQA